MVQDIAPEVSKGYVLYQMLPSNIRPHNDSKSPFRFISLAYKDEQEYKTDLRSGAIEKIYRLVESPFVPNQVAFMRRDMVLYAPQISERSEGFITYKFKDSSPFGGEVSIGDWVVIEEKQWLFQVTDIKDGRQIVLRPDVAESKVSEGETEAVYYAHIDPPKYYLDMLALYLHNLLLAYSPITTETVDKIDMLRLISQRSERPIKQPLPAKGSLLRKSNTSLQHIYQNIAYIYLKLSDHNNPDSYHRLGGDQSSGDFERIMRAVKSEAKELLNKVEGYFGIDKDYYEHKPPREEVKKMMGDEKLREIKEDFNKLKKSPLDFQDMIRRL